jgi:hypothetical protein
MSVKDMEQNIDSDSEPSEEISSPFVLDEIKVRNPDMLSKTCLTKNRSTME